MPDNKLQFKLNEFLPYRLLNVSEDMSLQFAEHYRRKYKMTRPEWRSFAILGEHGEITATEVGRISRMHKTKVSRAIAALADRGWLNRERDGSDRRIEHLKLTKRGQSNYSKLADEANAYSNEIAEKLGPEAMQIVWQAIEYLDDVKQ